MDKVGKKGHLGLKRGCCGWVKGSVCLDVGNEVLGFVVPYAGHQMGACAFHFGNL